MSDGTKSSDIQAPNKKRKAETMMEGQAETNKSLGKRPKMDKKADPKKSLKNGKGNGKLKKQAPDSEDGLDVEGEGSDISAGESD